MRKARRLAQFSWSRLDWVRRPWTRISWAIKVATPWALGAGLLISFTADAGQEVPSGASLAPISSKRAAVIPAQIAPPLPSLAADFGPHFGRGLLREARLELGAPELLATLPDEVEPRADLKRNARAFPEIDRHHKGDPLVGLRPSLQGRLRQKGAVERLRADILTFDQDESGLASTFSPGENDAPGPDSVASFEAWDEGEAPVTQPSSAGASPAAGAGALTMRPAALAERIAQGATPATPRAVALSSNTPFAADQTPIEADLSIIAKGERAAADRGNRRDYLARIAPEKLESEKRCLAQAIYFEARSEPEAGQAAVAQVVLNRALSGLYPATICGVVFQNRNHYHACQFSFACEGRSLRIREAEAWTQATRIAEDVLDGRTWNADVGGATHYHANYVRPRWARSLKKMDVIGKHIFYRLKSG
ncbi:MAG TPA: cell wall hydrolase [Rhodoblastus sp.]|nr:cell wall hydrolase [Rhodoblastus sp.]